MPLQTLTDVLDAQYKYLDQIFGNAIPTDILRHFKSATPTQGPIQIADIATGTGIWLLDQQSLFSTQDIKAEYHGFDITDSMFPAKETLSDNITFGTMDMLKDVPSSMRHRFDLVHIRFVALALTEGKHQQLAKNCMDMLKPGGFIMWEDFSLYGPWVSEDIPPAQAKYNLMSQHDLRQLMAFRGLPKYGTEEIGDVLRGVGFVEEKHKVVTSKVDNDKELEDKIRDNFAFAVKGLYLGFQGKPQMINKIGLQAINEGTTEEIDKFIKGVIEEWEEGHGSVYTYHLFSARKREE